MNDVRPLVMTDARSGASALRPGRCRRFYALRVPVRARRRPLATTGFAAGARQTSAITSSSARISGSSRFSLA